MGAQKVDSELLSIAAREIGLHLTEEDMRSLQRGRTIALEERMFPPESHEAGCDGILIAWWGSDPKCCIYLKWPPGLCVTCEF